MAMIPEVGTRRDKSRASTKDQMRSEISLQRVRSSPDSRPKKQTFNQPDAPLTQRHRVEPKRAPNDCSDLVQAGAKGQRVGRCIVELRQGYLGTSAAPPSSNGRSGPARIGLDHN